MVAPTLPPHVPILSGEEPDSTPERPPPGKGRAYITYEKLAELGSIMTSTYLRVEELTRQLTVYDKTQQDHEARIRALELFQAAQLAAQSASREGQASVRWTLERITALIALLASVGAVLITLAKQG